MVGNYNGYVCKYYVGDLCKKLLDVVPVRYKDEIFKYYQTIPNEIKNKASFAINPNAIETIYIAISKWLYERLKMFNPINEKNKNDELKEATKVIIVDTFKERIEQKLSGILDTETDTAEKLSMLIDELNSISATELEFKIIDYYRSMFGTTMPIELFFENIHAVVCKHVTETAQCISCINDKILFKPFEHSEENVIVREIYLKMCDFFKHLKLELEDVKKYHPDYTVCDHGVVSASILFQIIAFNERIATILGKEPILNLAYYNLDNIKKLGTDETTSSYAKVISSILLHNIYVKKAKKYGLDYKQDIDTKPFSYFCAFMDALQLWGRPKQIDQALLELPKEHFLENDFDIMCTDYNINIICTTIFAGSMRRQIDELENYLPGVSQLVKLCETEL